MATILCPRHWSPGAIADFNAVLAQHAEDEEVAIDFRPTYFVRPFGTLIMAETIRHFVAARSLAGHNTFAASADRVAEARSDALSYLKHVGFFQFIGLPYGKLPGEAPGSDRYLPITRVDFGELDVQGGRVRLQEALKDKCESLAAVLVQDDESRIMIGYCLREVMRNVYEHAQVGYCVAMAQKYPKKKNVELAIIDTGRGILASMQESHALTDPEQAISHALLPGVSRSLRSDDKDKWANSGFGLYVLSEIGKGCGQFGICSSGLLQMHRDDQVESRAIAYNGTGISVMVPLEDADYFPNLLQSIVKRGEEEAFARTGVPHSASMSTMGLWD